VSDRILLNLIILPWPPYKGSPVIKNLSSVPKLLCGLSSVPDLHDSAASTLHVFQRAQNVGFLFQVLIPITPCQIERFIVNPVTFSCGCQGLCQADVPESIFCFLVWGDPPFWSWFTLEITPFERTSTAESANLSVMLDGSECPPSFK
jgi:hypothetical protein